MELNEVTVTTDSPKKRGRKPGAVAVREKQELSKPAIPIITADDIRKYFCPKANEKEIFMALNIVKQWGLNPYKREVHFVKYKDDSPMQIVIGYETYLRNAEKSGKWSGLKVWTEGRDKELKACCNVSRNDWKDPFYHEVYFAEYCQYTRDYKTGEVRPTKFWSEKPLTMLKKVVVEQALRFAFPEQCGGLPYGNEELPIEPEINGNDTIIPENGKTTVEIPALIPASKAETAVLSDKPIETGKGKPEHEKPVKTAKEIENEYITPEVARRLNEISKAHNIKPIDIVAEIRRFYLLSKESEIKMGMIQAQDISYFELFCQGKAGDASFPKGDK